MKKYFLLITLIAISLNITGCSSFQETYKPLYQVKPEIENIEGKK